MTTKNQCEQWAAFDGILYWKGFKCFEMIVQQNLTAGWLGWNCVPGKGAEE